MIVHALTVDCHIWTTAQATFRNSIFVPCWERIQSLTSCTGEFGLLSSVEDRLVGGGVLSSVYDPINRVQERELQVHLQGDGPTSGRLEFEVEREHGRIKYELTLRVRDGIPGLHFVTIDGMQLGQLMVDDNGFARMELSTDPGGGEMPFAGGVIPRVQMDSVVTVGDFFVAQVGDGFPSTDGSVPTTQTRLTLTGNTALIGFLEYEVEPEDGGLKTELKVDVRNATPGSSLDFYVDGIDVGDLNIDDRGRGKIRFSTHPDSGELAFPAGFPQIQLGTTVSVSQLISASFTAHAQHAARRGSGIRSRIPSGVVWSHNCTRGRRVRNAVGRWRIPGAPVPSPRARRGSQ